MQVAVCVYCIFILVLSHIDVSYRVVYVDKNSLCER